MTTPTAHFVLTLALTDETTTEPDVIAAAVVNGISEVYPESLEPPVDSDPVWVNPQAATCLSPAAVKHLLDALTVGLDAGMSDVDMEVWAWIEAVRANVTLNDPWGWYSAPDPAAAAADAE